MTLEKVTPGVAVQDGLDGWMADTILLGQFGGRYSLSRMVLRCPARGTDFAYLLLGQLRFVMALAHWLAVHFVGVNNIATVSYPLKVVQAIIMRVAVLVIRDMSWRTSADKSCQDQRMNRDASMLSSLLEYDGRVAIRRSRFEDMACSPIANSSVVTHVVRPSFDWHPSLHSNLNITQEMTGCLL